MTTTWHGVTLDDRSAAMMDAVQALVDASPDPFTISPSQGSYSVSVGASAGTHAGGGAIDISAASLTTDQRDFLVAAMRQVGWADWLRTPAQGFSYHVHGIAIGCADLSDEAQTQVDSYLAGYNGLRGNGLDEGPRDWVGITWESYSGSAYVPPSGGTPVSVGGQFPGDRSGTYGDFPSGILTGTPSFTGGVFFRANQIDDEPPPVTLHMDAGDSCVLAVAEDWSYYEQDEDLSDGMYLIRATGTGTIAVADAWDEDYFYPFGVGSVTFTPQTSLGDAAGFEYFTASADLLDVSHLYDDGQPLIRLTCTGGSVDITWVGMQLDTITGYYVADGGFVWSAGQPADSRPVPNSGFEDTYDTYDAGGGDIRWTVDDTAPLEVSPDGRVSGADVYTSAVDEGPAGALAAIELALVAKAMNVGSGTILQAEFNAPPASSSPLPPPYTWAASIEDGSQWWTSPTKSTLPNQPAGLPTVAYLQDGFEWLDANTEFLGWRLFHSYEGTADEVQWEMFGSSSDGGHAGYSLTAGSSASSGALPASSEIASGGDSVELDQADVATGTNRLYGMAITCTPDTPGSGVGALRAVRVSDSTPLALSPVDAVFRIPPWRYKIPTFVSVAGPPPFIDFDEDPSGVVYLRNRQRNDGLGGWSVPRTKGISSQQRSIHNRGYR